MLSLSTSPARYAASTTLFKLRSAEHERVERLVAKMERSVRRAFIAFLENVQSPAIMRQVAELLGSGDIEGALGIVDQYIKRMAPVLSRVFTDSAMEETSALAEDIKRMMPVAGISFDPTHPRAAEMMRQSQLGFIRYFSDSQRKAVRQALSEALMDGRGPLDAARAFRDAIGLTPSQLDAVRNYRRLLTAGSREALDRDLRDRRFDGSILRAANTGDPLSESQIETMVERYRQRSLMYRAEMIARTETSDVVSAARQEAFDQIVEDVAIPDSMIEREWRWNKDGRTRDSHSHMQVSVVQGRSAPFVTGNGVAMMRPHDPSAPAEERICCRCFQLMRIKKRER